MRNHLHNDVYCILSHRRIFILSVIVIALFGVCFPVYAAPDTVVYINPTTYTADFSEDFHLDVRIDPGTNEVTAIVVDLTFDETVLRLDAITPSVSFPDTLVPADIDNVNGTASITLGVGTGNPRVTTDSIVVVLDFHALSEGTDSPVTFTTATQAAAAGEAGNVVVTRTGGTVTVNPLDATPPTITNVTSDKPNGSYTVGEAIDIDVTFSEPVTSSGNVTVTLETGTIDRTCTFTVSSATTGTCTYTVQAGDTTSDLTVSSIGGTIEDDALNAMVNFTPATNLATNKALVIDTTAPTTPGNPTFSAVSTSEVTVSWAGATDAQGVTGYRVYRGTTAGTLSLITTTAGGVTTFPDTGLTQDTTYYYGIRALDGAGNVSATTSVLATTTVTETTPPSQATTPSPANGATKQSISAALTFESGDRAESHALYFGATPGIDELTDYRGTSSSPSYNPGTLAYSTTYYWRVDEVNSYGTTTGVVWSFTTSAKPSSSGGGGGGGSKDSSADILPVTPKANSANVSTKPVFSWSSVLDATQYVLYLGTSPSTYDKVVYASTNNSTFAVQSALATSTTYYWRIDVETPKRTYRGDRYSFKTSFNNISLSGAKQSTVQWIHGMSVESPHRKTATVFSNIPYSTPLFNYRGIPAMLIKAHTYAGVIVLTAGSGSRFQKVGPSAFLYTNGRWTSVVLQQVAPTGSDGLFVGSGSYLLQPSSPLYAPQGILMVYMKMSLPGCDNSSCVIDGYVLQEFGY